MDNLTKYKQLSPCRRSAIVQKFTDLFGSRFAFYRKIKGAVRVTKAEQLFFNQHLN